MPSCAFASLHQELSRDATPGMLTAGKSDAEVFPQNHQLADVVRIVVGQGQGLLQDGLAVSMGYSLKQINRRVEYQALHGSMVSNKLLDASVPRRFIGRNLPVGPVTVRIGGRYVIGTLREPQDVPL